MNTIAAWFKIATFIGVLVNIFAMALPFIFAPQWYLDSFDLPGGGASVIWMRQAGLLLLFISLLYIFGGLDPIRYSWNAIFSVLVRFVVGSYWLWLVFGQGQSHSFLMIGIFDCLYAILSGVILWLLLKNSQCESVTSQ